MSSHRTGAADSENCIGLVRLVLSYAVIISHSYELLDGNRNREPLSRVLHGLSLGDVAVLFFFVVSGYLVTGSYVNTSTASGYIAKRILRIYPGYLAAFIICLIVVGPVASDIDLREWPGLLVLNAKRLALLQAPELPGVFSGSYYPALNGSMWTISYEFRCYLLVLLFGAVGAFNRGHWVAAFTLVLLVATTLNLHSIDEVIVLKLRGISAVFGDIEQTIQLTAAFCCGMCMYIYFEKIGIIRYWHVYVIFSLVCMLVFLSQASTEVIGVSVFAGYVVLTIAFNTKNALLCSIGRSVDLSYGVYLYAWPIQKVVILFAPGIDVIVHILAAIVGSSIVAWFSWRLVEQPFLKLKTKANARVREAPPSASE